MQQSLEDHLRRSTRNFTARLPEDQVLALARDLARELATAHAESPPRHPDLEPSAIPMLDGKPQLASGGPTGDASEDLLVLGALVNAMALATSAEVAWRLDGPPLAEASTLTRKAVFAALGSPRREERFATAAAAAEAIEAALAPTSETPAPWPLFRGDVCRSGARAAAPAPGRIETAWEAKVGSVVGSPLLTAKLVLAPTADGRLLFLDRANGRRVHEMRLASAMESSPAVLDRLLYVGTDDGEVVAVDVVSGVERHRVKLGQVVRSSPLPVADLVLVGVVEGKGAGGVAAIDAKGKIAWRRKLGPVFSSPAAAGATILVGSDEGSVHALDASSGNLLWSYAASAKVRATPAVSGELAVVGDFAGRLVALRVADGSAAWTLELGHPMYSSPCLAADLCVVGCNEGHVHGVDMKNGQPRFEALTRGPVVSSAAALGERFLIGSTDGDLYLLDTSGAPLQRASLAGGAIQSSPAADTDFLAVGSAAGLHGLRVMP